jgi:hypothetical protein
MRNPRHREIHADLRALACEIGAQIREDILANALCCAYNMLDSPCHTAVLLVEL